MKILLFGSVVWVLLLSPIMALGVQETGEGPNLGTDRITQDQIEDGLSLRTVLLRGQRIFSTPFNRYDGYGDGPYDPTEDPRLPGGRTTLQGNGTFLRVNGLDGQTCLECHFIVKNSTIPATLGIGGMAGAANNVIIAPSYIDTAEVDPGTMNGRFTSPPFLFGAGGVELLAKEMTIDLQRFKTQALDNPGTPVPLFAKGVYFGTIVSDDGIDLDTSGIEGIDADLVVRPFGRKGDFATVREFSIEALQFHFGMQAIEAVGEDVDADGDGIVNEILAGELSALHIFGTNLPKPIRTGMRNPQAARGSETFSEIGCTNCHIPTLETRTKRLTYSFPEVAEDPAANVFYRVNLKKRANFRPNRAGGLLVNLFSDLKRHDMGDALSDRADFLSTARNREFVTARLWGLRDSAPFLHDGRAMTITDAILMHGGESQAARDNFSALSEGEMADLVAFLYTLRTPFMSNALLRLDRLRGAVER